MVGANQADLTQSELPFDDRLNKVLADVIVSINGYEWGAMTVKQKLDAVKGMLDADRKALLVAARYCSLRSETFCLKHEWTERGVKQEQQIDLPLLNADNIGDAIDSIVARWGCDRDTVVSANYCGGMATKPYKKQFSTYPIARSEMDYEVEVQGINFRLQYLTAAMHPKGMKEKDIDAHTSLLIRLPRYYNADKENWYSLTRDEINGMDISMLDALRTAIHDNEGLIDSVSTFSNPNGHGKDITVDVLGEVAFFFPSGRI